MVVGLMLHLIKAANYHAAHFVWSSKYRISLSEVQHLTQVLTLFMPKDLIVLLVFTSILTRACIPLGFPTSRRRSLSTALCCTNSIARVPMYCVSLRQQSSRWLLPAVNAHSYFNIGTRTVGPPLVKKTLQLLRDVHRQCIVYFIPSPPNGQSFLQSFHSPRQPQATA